MKGELKRTVMVYVDSYDDGILKGRVARADDLETQSFQSLGQLLKIIEQGLNHSGYPQAFEKLRMFGDSKALVIDNEPEHDNRRGKLATFAIRILFRQNASWQGSVFWPEGRLEESFRSVLELIFLMDSAMHGSHNSNETGKMVLSS